MNRVMSLSMKANACNGEAPAVKMLQSNCVVIITKSNEVSLRAAVRMSGQLRNFVAFNVVCVSPTIIQMGHCRCSIESVF